MPGEADFDAGDFADRLAQMSDDEQDVLSKRQLAYERDPDPAEETVEEPANDWPGADNRSGAKE